MNIFLKYVGVRGILAVIFAIGIITMTILGQPVPSEMYALAGLIVGFYFGGRRPLNGLNTPLRTMNETIKRRK